jgi:hypothetical protein
MLVTASHVETWASRYFHAWKTNDAALVGSLFSQDAVYYYGPFRPPARGRGEIVARWVATAHENLETQYEVVAVHGSTGVVHWRVSWGQRERTEMDGVLIVRFDESGVCCEHCEWFDLRKVPGTT